MNRNPIKPDEYRRLVSKMTPHSRHLRGCVRAFWVGGLICALGQALNALGERLMLDEATAPMFTSVALVFLGTTLTGLGVYDRIGKYAGAGSVVPITGFANAMVAPAIEFRQEGLVTGVGAKMFSIAGPVIVFGVSASVLAGLLSLLFV